MFKKRFLAVGIVGAVTAVVVAGTAMAAGPGGGAQDGTGPDRTQLHTRLQDPAQDQLATHDQTRARDQLQDGTCTDCTGPVRDRAGSGSGNGLGAGGVVGGPEIPLAAAAEVTGLTQEQLQAQMQAGASLEEIVQNMGVEAQFQATVAAARQEALQAAVQNGTLSQERADTMAQHMAQNQADCDGTAAQQGSRYGADR